MVFHQTSKLSERGVILPDPQSVYVEHDVLLDRLSPGAILHPGARVAGPDTVLAAGSEVGTEGPARIKNVAMGAGASIASGSIEGATLLDGASFGPNSHVRTGTLLEESASTGHAVGLKQTILLSFVTLGSQINFCDCLMAGGTSRSDHSEVGSGFIHFNFTPFGARGDKATASLFGDVTAGVFLNQARIFLGGSGGVVGPTKVDYGTTLAAGSVYRKDYGTGLLVYGEKTIAKSRPFDPLLVRHVGQRTARCLTYIGELRALFAWYRDIRLPAAGDRFARLVIESGMARIADGIGERKKQIDRFLDGAQASGDEAVRDIEQTRNSWATLASSFATTPAATESSELRDLFLADLSPSSAHVAWVQSLGDDKISQGRAWLESVAKPTNSEK